MSELSEKARTVMREYGKRKLRSSSGQLVTNPNQAFAIAKSEERRSRRRRGKRRSRRKSYRS